MYLNNYQVNIHVTTSQSENIASTQCFPCFPSQLDYNLTPAEKFTAVNFIILRPAFLYNFTTTMYF